MSVAAVRYALPPPGTQLNWLKAIIDVSPIGLMLVGKREVFACSGHCEELLGLSAEEIHDAEQLISRVRHPDGKPYQREDLCFVRAIEHGEVISDRLMVAQLPDGTTRLLCTHARPVRDEEESIVGAVVMVEDVTLQRETEARLRASETLLRHVFEILPVGVWITDAQGRITMGNPAGQRIWRGTRYVGVEEFGQYKGWRVEDGRPLAAADWALARAIRNGESSIGELIRIQCFDGSFKVIINSAAPVRDDDGRLLGAIAVNEDITALHEVQDKLRAAVLDRERILGIVSHDLRSPLAALMLGAERLRQQAGADTAPGLEAIQRTLVRMAGLVDDLLAVAVGPSGGLLERSRIAAHDLLEQAVRAARAAYEGAGVSIAVQAQANLPAVEADMNRVLRVFANLADNALKFSEPGAVVTFGAEAVAGNVRFSVANSGSALPRGQLKRMFEPFWQAGRDPRGAGLGMSICRTLVEAHGGTIWAEPAAGQRVRICFDLPRSAGGVKPAEASAPHGV